jgi:uncharacterized protein
MAEVPLSNMRRKRLRLAEARRIALAAQGFGKPRPTKPATAGHIRRVIERLGLLQLDFVNVLLPAHRLIPYSRLGSYRHDAFDRAVYDSGNFTEQWAHEASIVPVGSWPLLAHRREAFKTSPRNPILKMHNRHRYLEDVLRQVTEQGALTANDLPAQPGPKRKPGDWHRSIARCALDYHFGRGNLAVRSRLANFQRLYDLPERLIPAAHREREISPPAAQYELLEHAARALGIATARDLADYFRMPMRECLPQLGALQRAGVIDEVSVEGWTEPAWLHAEARLPRQITADALLSPFDPVVWYRPRAERLFGFHYRIEIYVPEKQRRWGYYVLPFLCDDRIVARVDLKADRNEGVLRIPAAHAEEGMATEDIAGRLATELRGLANWLDLADIKVGRRGNFATLLAKALRDSVGH